MGNGICANEKTRLAINGRACPILLFSGESVSLGTLQSTEYHFVLGQCSSVNISRNYLASLLPFDIHPVTNNDTLIEIYQFVQAQFFQNLHKITPLRRP